jgi:hypothetical protein
MLEGDMVPERNRAEPHRSLECCPQCGGPVEGGFLLSQRGIAWSVRKKIGFRDVEKFSSFLGSEWFPAQRCQRCRLAIFRY